MDCEQAPPHAKPLPLALAPSVKGPRPGGDPACSNNPAASSSGSGPRLPAHRASDSGSVPHAHAAAPAAPLPELWSQSSDAVQQHAGGLPRGGSPPCPSMQERSCSGGDACAAAAAAAAATPSQQPSSPPCSPTAPTTPSPPTSPIKIARARQQSEPCPIPNAAAAAAAASALLYGLRRPVSADARGAVHAGAVRPEHDRDAGGEAAPGVAVQEAAVHGTGLLRRFPVSEVLDVIRDVARPRSQLAMQVIYALSRADASSFSHAAACTLPSSSCSPCAPSDAALDLLASYLASAARPTACAFAAVAASPGGCAATGASVPFCVRVRRVTDTQHPWAGKAGARFLTISPGSLSSSSSSSSGGGGSGVVGVASAGAWGGGISGLHRARESEQQPGAVLPAAAAGVEAAGAWDGRGGSGGVGRWAPLPPGYLVVDASLKQQLATPRMTPRYRQIWSALPDVFVGHPTTQLAPLLALLAYELRMSFECLGLTLPPWRSHEALAARWLSPWCEEADVPAPAPAAPRPQATATAATPHGMMAVRKVVLRGAGHRPQQQQQQQQPAAAGPSCCFGGAAATVHVHGFQV